MLDLVLMIIIMLKPIVEIIVSNHNNKMMTKLSVNIFNTFKNKIKVKVFSLVFITLSKTSLSALLNLYLKFYVLFHFIKYLNSY